MDVYLVRHAIAETRDSTQWPDDSERPLTPEGEARFRKAARGLRRVAPQVDVVLASPYVRAWQTAEILEREAGWPAPERAPELEATRAPADGVELLRRHASNSVALVGHEPCLSGLASLLLAGDEHAEWHMQPPDPDEPREFEFGLDLILDGLERLRDTT